MRYSMRIILACVILFSATLLADWQHLGLGDLRINAIKRFDTALYAASNDGVYRLSHDRAPLEWTPIGLQGMDISALLVLNADTIFAGLSSGTVSIYRTTNGGLEWAPFENGYGGGSFYPVFSFARPPDDVNTIYATGTAVTARSTDCGWNWQVVFGAAPPGEWNPAGICIWFVKVDPSNSEIVWSGGESMSFSPILVKSTNGGLDWFSAAVPYTGDNACHDVAISHDNSNEVFVSMEGKIYKTADGAENWVQVLQNIFYIYEIEIDSLRPELVYSSGGQLGKPLTIYASKDGGDSWYSFMEGSHAENWAHDFLLVSDSDQNILYLGTNHGIYRYTDLLTYLCGDADHNQLVHNSDTVYILSFIFGGGKPPEPFLSGDVDCNLIVNISDAVYLIAYIFAGGPEPCAGCS